MTDTPNDDEFREIHVDTPAATDPETPQAEAEAQADADVIEAGDKPDDADKPDAEKPEEVESDDDKPLRDEKGKFKGGVQGRIDELTRARREAERTAEYWKGLATRNGAATGPDAAPASKPTPDQFEDYGEFIEALVKFSASELNRQNIDTRATEAASAVETHRAAEWGGKVTAAKAAIPDFDTVMETADTPTLPHVAQAIMAADRGPELLYHLAQPGNEAIVEQLNEMSPYRAAIELGRIEATLTAPKAPTPPTPPRETKQTKAPAPITPVGSGSTVAKDPSKMSMEEYTAFRKEQGIR